MGASAIDFWVWPIPEKKKQGIDDLNKILSGGTQQMFFDLTVSILRSRIPTIHCPKNHGISSHWWFGDLRQTPLLRKTESNIHPSFLGPIAFSHANFKEESGSSCKSSGMILHYIQGFTSPGSKWVRAFGPFWNKKGQGDQYMWVWDGGSGDVFRLAAASLPPMSVEPPSLPPGG